MKNNLRSLLGLFGFILLLSAVSLAVWKYAGVGESVKDVISSVKSKNLIKSNSSELEFKIGYDGYFGYAVLESKKFARALEGVNLSIDLQDDNANYPQRFAKLLEGDIDMAVMPIHDYLQQLSLNTPEENLPLIISAISESKGADAVLANPKVVPNINTLKELKRVKAAYTSQFMISSMAVDANIPLLMNARSMEANDDIEKTYNGLLSGKYDLVGLWEPYISKAKAKGFIVLMGSDELKLGKIVDVLVINRTFLANHKVAVELFLQKYFESALYYQENMSNLIHEIEIKEGGELTKADISVSLDNIKFYTLSDNAYNLFRAHSLSSEKILDYIDAIVIKLQKMSVISDNPIKKDDARNIVYANLLQEVFNSYPAGSIVKPKKEDKVYSPITDENWKKLIKNPKFTRDDLEISFLRDGRLNSEGKAVLDDFAQNSINNFDYYIAVVGRSGKARGLSEAELIKRTDKKALQVYDYLVKYWSIDKNRLHSIGLGSKGITPQKDGQNYYQYLNKNNKVELLFVDY